MDMDRNFKQPFFRAEIYRQRAGPVKPAELSKSCGLVGVLDGGELTVPIKKFNLTGVGSLIKRRSRLLSIPAALK